jgi:hypothetical protein
MVSSLDETPLHPFKGTRKRAGKHQTRLGVIAGVAHAERLTRCPAVHGARATTATRSRSEINLDAAAAFTLTVALLPATTIISRPFSFRGQRAVRCIRGRLLHDQRFPIQPRTAKILSGQKEENGQHHRPCILGPRGGHCASRRGALSILVGTRDDPNASKGDHQTQDAGDHSRDGDEKGPSDKSVHFFFARLACLLLLAQPSQGSFSLGFVIETPPRLSASRRSVSPVSSNSTRQVDSSSR